MEQPAQEAEEDTIDLGIFFKFEDIDSLPRVYCEKLSLYCEQSLAKVEKIEELLKERELDDSQPEVELSYFRMAQHAKLMTAPLYKNEGVAAKRSPDFKKYMTIVDDDGFIFI